jgi:hypothetical protein
MKKIEIEVQSDNRNLIGKLWTIFKVCFVAVFFAWWLATSFLLLLAIYAIGLQVYHGTPIELPRGDTISACWGLAAALLFFYYFTLRPFLRGGAFRR